MLEWDKSKSPKVFRGRGALRSEAVRTDAVGSLSGLEGTSFCDEPHAFIDKRGNPVVISPLHESQRPRLIQLYLDFTPKAAFSGLPPSGREECIAWVNGMATRGKNLIALCFEEGVAGHAAIFPVNRRRCELFIGVANGRQDSGIGTELVRRIIQLAYELEFEEIWLAVEVRNRRAQHVYSKCGFEYLGGSETDELEMLLPLKRMERMEGTTVAQVMNTKVVTITEQHTWQDALDVFLTSRVGSLPVVDDDNKLVGILSQTDLLIMTGYSVPVGDILTRQVITLDTACPLSRAIRLFQSKRMRCIPVVDGDENMKLVGVIGRRDILSFYGRQ